MALGPLVGSIGILAAVALLLSRETGYERPDRFIIATSAGTPNVLWARMPSFQDMTLPVKDQAVPAAEILIDGAASRCTGWTCSADSDRGLKEPSGLALFQKGGGSAWLYVSDPKVSRTWRGTLQVGPQQLVASNLKDKAHWLAVDSYGNLFYTDSEAGTISMISAEDMYKHMPEGRTVLSAEKTEFVAGPAGLAADSTSLYWANLKGDQATGTLVQAQANDKKQATILAGNRDMYQAIVKDICLAGENVFFTGDGKSLFAVKADGSSNVTEIAHLQQPAGCVYDQETTLFVADREDNAIYSLPANMGTLHKVKRVRKVASLDSPHQIAIFFGPSSNKFLQHLSE
ncbi:unnamed protein product [Effrenium voratum]|uniref:SMP-30/Gluconolactonase/LRE-like region domain-containing protein n=1 Tax=Effrenium voratum TaxID=2562239 RepID=A0AA36HXQ5_9DINO|nr:unnamed protein product [Effrenium voratum]